MRQVRCGLISLEVKIFITMGDCLTTTTKSQALPNQQNQKQQDRAKPTIVLATCPAFDKTHTVTSVDPNINIKAPPFQQKQPPRQPSIDLRESVSNRSRSRSRSCSRSNCGSKSSRSRSGSQERKKSGDSILASRLGSKSVSNDSNNGNLGIVKTDSYMVRKSEEENRRSSNVPVQINPTVSYLVNAGGNPKSRPEAEVEFSLVNGEILISQVEPISKAPPGQNVEKSTGVMMTTRQDNPAAPQAKPIVQQSRILVNTKLNVPQEEAYPRPAIDQSAIIINTRSNNP